MYAVKDNRIYTIDAAEKQHYIDRGYKIAKLEDKELVYEKEETKETKEIAKLEAENEALKAKIKELEKPKKEDK